jgi:hypothetical protein
MNRLLLKRRSTRLAVLSAVLLTLAPTWADAAPQSVADFLRMKPRWEKLVGLQFLLEGRFGGSAGPILLLRKLPLGFHADEEIERRYDSDDVLHVLGELRRDGQGQLYFRLLDVRRARSDMDWLNERVLELPPKEHEPVYELADWAEQRARFYDDDKLQAEATALYDRALRREQASLKTRDYAAFRDLAIKAGRYGLGEARKNALLYEGRYREWQLVRRDMNGKQLAGLAAAVASELPGAAVPVPIVDQEFRDRWKQEPLHVYETSTFGFEQMHRFLYQEISLDSIQKEARDDGSNGRAVAARLQQEVPEFAEMSADFVRKELENQIRNVTQLTIDAMLELRELLVDAGEADKADEILRRWFTDREAQLRKEGLDGLIELASLHETLFPDGAREAISVLLEAERRKPGSAIVRQRLESHGYRQLNGDWKSSEEVRDFENSPINRAMREGRVIPGMTQEQVRRALGEPASVSRLLTARQVIEYWVYGDPGRRSRLTVRLSRQTQRRSAIVVDSREVAR